MPDASGTGGSVRAELTARVAAALGDQVVLRETFRWLTGAVGADEGSRLWWSVFAATDATDT